MASGYEKSDCKLDRDGGWGQPSRLENRILLVVGLAGAALWLSVHVTIILRVIRWFAN